MSKEQTAEKAELDEVILESMVVTGHTKVKACGENSCTMPVNSVLLGEHHVFMFVYLI